MLEIVIFAIVAFLLFLKLKSILGNDDQGFNGFNNMKNSNFLRFKSGASAEKNEKNAFRPAPNKDLKDITNKAKETHVNADKGIDLTHLGFKLVKKPKEEEKSVESSDKVLDEQLKLLEPSLHAGYKELYKSLPTPLLITHFIEGVETVFEEIYSIISEKHLSNSDVVKQALSSQCFKQLEDAIPAEGEENTSMIHLEKVQEIKIKHIGISKNGLTLNAEVEIHSTQIRYTASNGNAPEMGSKSIPLQITDTITLSRKLPTLGQFWTVESFTF